MECGILDAELQGCKRSKDLRKRPESPRHMPNTAYCQGKNVVIECEINTLENPTMNSKRYMETLIED
jgi:hypothetical protein